MSYQETYYLTTYSPLTIIAPMLRYNLSNDDFGNKVVVSASAWESAYYFANN